MEPRIREGLTPAEAHALGDYCDNEDCGICEQLRDDLERAEERDRAEADYEAHGDYLRDLAKDGGF